MREPKTDPRLRIDIAKALATGRDELAHLDPSGVAQEAKDWQLPLRREQLALLALQVLGDLIIILSALVLAYKLREKIDILGGDLRVPSFTIYIQALVVVSLVLLPTFAFQGLYRFRRGTSRIDQFFKIVSAVSIGLFASQAVISLTVQQSEFLSRPMILYAWLLLIFLVSCWRSIYTSIQARLHRRGINVRRVLIIGADRVGRLIYDRIKRTPSLGFVAVGFLDDRAVAGASVDTTKVLGRVSSVTRVVREHNINDLIISSSAFTNEDVLQLTVACQYEDVEIKVFPNLFQLMSTEINIGDLNGLPLITLKKGALHTWNRFLKRSVDIIFSILVLILLSPLMLLIALLIKLTSPGSVFYIQTRVGRDNKPFPCIKFRSMRRDAEDDTGPVMATADDQRRTFIGTFLRRTSLDELPQFINVLLGDMSVVGPRPERPNFVEENRRNIPRYMDRHRLRAGITGWAQVNGLRGQTPIADRTEYDLYYLENWSLLFDFKIMLKTLAIMLTDKQAY